MSEEFKMERFSNEMERRFGKFDEAGEKCLKEARNCYDFVSQEKKKEELANIYPEMNALASQLYHFIDGKVDKTSVAFAFCDVMRKVDKMAYEERKVERKAKLCALFDPILEKVFDNAKAEFETYCEKAKDELMAELLKALI